MSSPPTRSSTFDCGRTLRPSRIEPSECRMYGRRGESATRPDCPTAARLSSTPIGSYALSDRCIAPRPGLDVALRNGSEDLHPVTLRDRTQVLLVEVASSDRGGELIEVPDHRRGHVEVQLLARDCTDAEAMHRPCRDEDERSSRATGLT